MNASNNEMLKGLRSILACDAVREVDSDSKHGRAGSSAVGAERVNRGVTCPLLHAIGLLTTATACKSCGMLW